MPSLELGSRSRTMTRLGFVPRDRSAYWRIRPANSTARSRPMTENTFLTVKVSVGCVLRAHLRGRFVRYSDLQLLRPDVDVQLGEPLSL